MPIFCLALLVPVMEAPFSGHRSQYFPFTRNQVAVLFSLAAVFVVLCVITFFQLTLDLESPTPELSHAAVRLCFLVYCGICIYFVQGNAFMACLYWLRRILVALALYGIYQLPAKILGLPLFLDWLRNNRSFDIYHYDTAGWVNLVRATSIYAEPSQCTVPILVLMLLNIYLPVRRYSKAIVWIVVVLFTILTFSRTTWIAIIALIVAGLIAKTRILQRQSQHITISVAVLLLAVTLIMPTWAFYSANYKADLSRQERAGSVVIGLNLIIEHPWLGSGWNSYETLMPSYPIAIEGVSPDVEFRTIHNMFVSYTEQAGFAGFIFALFPFAIMLFKSEAPTGLMLGSVLSLLTVAELGGDVAYSSLFWLWVALVLNWPRPGSVDAAKLALHQ